MSLWMPMVAWGVVKLACALIQWQARIGYDVRVRRPSPTCCALLRPASRCETGMRTGRRCASRPGPATNGRTVLSSGEEEKFWLFYRDTSEVLHRKAYRMCRGNVADAEDAHQETYLQALKHWTALSDMADKQRNAWLATTLSNEVLQIWRAPHRTREAAAPDHAGRDPGSPVVTSDDGALVAADDLHGVCRAIARLEGRQREVVALHCLAGYEISEVAEMLGISQVRVRVHLHSGRASVRKILAREEEDPPDG